jgi:hypothetical protein
VLSRLLPLLLLSAASTFAGDLTLARVFTGWRDAASFKRISEYFTGKENTGGEIVLRTHPGQRAGFYFLARLADNATPLKVRFRVQWIAPGAPTLHTETFAAELPAGASVYQLGLTGPEWQDPKSQPVAWHLQIVAADDGRVLAGEKSYLWEKPAAK